MYIPPSEGIRMFFEREKGSGPHPLSFLAYPLRNKPRFVSVFEKKDIMDYYAQLEEKSNGGKGAIYVHIPFCESICTFCCYFKVLKDEKLVKKYLHALKREIEIYSSRRYVRSMQFCSLYFGGGTPTCLSSEQLFDILEYCKSSFRMTGDAAITMEGCTYNFEKEKLEAAISHGVTRVSFGIQTFDEGLRRILNMKDSGKEAIASLKNALMAGYKEVDIDLIYNLPGQSLDKWKKDLKTAIDLGINSITLYPLGLYREAQLYSMMRSGKVPEIGDAEKEMEMYITARDMLMDAGYKPRTYTNFALSQSLRRWPIPEDYIALGAVAYGSVGNYAYRNTMSIEKYIESIEKNILPVSELIRLSKIQKMRRYMIKNMLRMKADIMEFKKMFGTIPQDVFDETLNLLKDMGLIEEDQREIRMSPEGMVWGDNVCRAFCDERWREEY